MEHQLFSRENLERALHLLGMVIIHYDIPAKTLTVPEHAAKRLGIDAVLPNVPDALIDTGRIIDNAEELRRFFNAICNGSPRETVRAEVIQAAAVPVWIECHSVSIFDENEAPLYAMISVAEASDKREMAYSYKKWEPIIRAQIAESIHYYDHNLTADKVELIGGYNPTVYPAECPSTFSARVLYVAEHIIHPDDREAYTKNFSREDLLQQFAENKPESKMIHRRLQSDGEYLWVQRNVHLFADAFNQDIHIMIMIKKLDSTLAKMQQELQADMQDLLNNSFPGGFIISYNRAGYPVYYINDHMLNYLGYTYDEFMAATGGFSSNFVHPDDNPAVVASADQAVKRKEDYEMQYRVIKKDGSVGWVIERGRERTDKNGQDILISVIVDVTDIITLQDDLKRTAEEAAEATRMKSLFLANMSHELRTPMNGILGFVELAADEPDIPATIRTFLDKIKLSSISLLDILNDILDISKIEAGKMELEHISFNLHDVFTHCENISRIRAEEKGVALYFYSEPFVWQKLMGDPTKLKQVLLNLLSNAIKFTEKGYVKLDALLESSGDNYATIHFTIRDSGIGMTAEELARVFAPFSQADNSTTRKYGGTGLGLTITRDIIHLMGGELHTESSPGVGSTFSFSITFETTNETAMITNQAVQVIKKPRFSGEVLVCEDNSINQQVISEHLSRIGLTPVIAENGQVGVDMVMERLMNGKSYDLILMDIHMPIMDGIEATHKLLSLGITTPIIALTANAMKRDRESYLSLGMSDYVSKPFYAQELWSCLLKYLTPLEMKNEEVSQAAHKAAVNPDSALDYRLGLEHAANDEELYTHLKRNFVMDNQHKYVELCENMDENDLSVARRIAHSLKSNAGWIGALELSQCAADIELSLAEGKTCTPNQLAKLNYSLNRVIKELAPLLDDHSDIAARMAKLMLSPAELADKLEPLLKAGNADCLQYLGEIGSTFAGFGEYRDTLVKLISDYDFYEAAETLARIKEQL